MSPPEERVGWGGPKILPALRGGCLLPDGGLLGTEDPYGFPREESGGGASLERVQKGGFLLRGPFPFIKLLRSPSQRTSSVSPQ